jgi:hypothetical protein
MQRGGGAGGPPPPPDSDSSSSGTSTDPLDTNGDGTVSAQERAVGELKDFMSKLASTMDTNGDKTVSQTEADSFKSSLSSLVDMAMKQYGQAAANTSTIDTSASVSLAA